MTSSFFIENNFKVKTIQSKDTKDFILNNLFEGKRYIFMKEVKDILKGCLVNDSMDLDKEMSLLEKEPPVAGAINIYDMSEETEQTSGGIFIPDSAKEKPQKGEVVAVGEGKLNDKGEREPMDVKVGDVVLYAKYAGTDIKMDGVEYKILSIKDALAVVE